MEELFFLSIEGEEEWFSFFQGPVGDNAVIAIDIAAQIYIDDQQPEDDSESFGYYSGPISDDALLSIDQILNWSDDEQIADDGNLDFYAGPLSADFIVSSNVPYASFDDYADAFEGEEYSFYLGIVGVPVIPVIPQNGGGGYWAGKTRRKDEDEDEETLYREPAALEIVKIGKSANEIITGLVAPKSKITKLKPVALTALDALNKSSFDSARARRDRIRKIQLADDEWLLLN